GRRRRFLYHLLRRPQNRPTSETRVSVIADYQINRLFNYPISGASVVRRARVRAGDNDRGPVWIEGPARGRVDLVERHSRQEIGQAGIVVEPEAEEFPGLQEVRDGRVRFQRARD